MAEATKIFQKWKISGLTGLTTETFTACIQTMGALPELPDYLIQQHGFQYVLTGKPTSDPIEGRFGWHRQAKGGNFFMSVKQLFLTEKKIRCLSLLQQNALLAAVSEQPSVVNEITTKKNLKEDVTWLVDYFSEVLLEDFPRHEAAVTYYVSSYIGQSIARRRKCAACSKLLICEKDAALVEDVIPVEYKENFETANHGGLSEPSEYCFVVTALAVQC